MIVVLNKWCDDNGTNALNKVADLLYTSSQRMNVGLIVIVFSQL